MKLDTNEEILQEAKAITEFKGRDLRQWLYREILLNALKTKKDRLDVLDLKVVSRTMDEFRYAARVFKPYRDIRKGPSLAQPASLKAILITNWLPILAAG